MAEPSLTERLREHLRATRLFAQGGLALVAVSGGADSLALLDLLASLAPELGLSLAVAINAMLRAMDLKAHYPSHPAGRGYRPRRVWGGSCGPIWARG